MESGTAYLPPDIYNGFAANISAHENGMQQIFRIIVDVLKYISD